MKFSKLLAVIMIGFLSLMLPFNQAVKSDYECPTTLFVSSESLDFNRWSKNSSPTMSFIIANSCDGTLKGTLTPSADWIKVSDTSIESNLKEIIVTLNVSNLSPDLYKEKIEIKSNGGDYTLPVRLDLVEKKVVILITYDNKIVVVDSKPVLLDYAPFVKSGWSYLPLRLICESFGATVSFEYVGVGKERKKVITILHKDQPVKLFFNENYIEMNGIKRNMDGPMEIRGYTAFIPLNTVKTLFDPIVQYNSKFRTITLIY